MQAVSAMDAACDYSAQLADRLGVHIGRAPWVRGHVNGQIELRNVDIPSGNNSGFAALHNKQQAVLALRYGPLDASGRQSSFTMPQFVNMLRHKCQVIVPQQISGSTGQPINRIHGMADNVLHQLLLPWYCEIIDWLSELVAKWQRKVSHNLVFGDKHMLAGQLWSGTVSLQDLADAALIKVSGRHKCCIRFTNLFHCCFKLFCLHQHACVGSYIHSGQSSSC